MTAVPATRANDCKRGRAIVRTARGKTAQAKANQPAIAHARSVSDRIANPSVAAAIDTIPVAITKVNAPASTPFGTRIPVRSAQFVALSPPLRRSRAFCRHAHR